MALDSFSSGYTWGVAILAFLIHLTPAFLVLALLVIAWRWEWVGTAAYAALAIWYSDGFWQRHPDWVVMIAGPLMLLAALFLINWLKHDELRARP